jgi:hypothetical protein
MRLGDVVTNQCPVSGENAAIAGVSRGAGVDGDAERRRRGQLVLPGDIGWPFCRQLWAPAVAKRCQS